MHCWLRPWFLLHPDGSNTSRDGHIGNKAVELAGSYIGMDACTFTEPADGTSLLLPSQILNSVDDHSGSDRNHQNVARNAHVAIAGRRRADLQHQRLRH